MQVKYYPRFSRAFNAKMTAAALVFLLSLAVMPLYTGGDQGAYRRVYETLPSLNLIEGFSFYSRSLTSREFVHFFLSWVASHFIDKDLFIAFSNAILAYVAMSLFLKWKASILIGFLVLLTNFYFLVLYFAAERLKFGFIFLALTMIHIDEVKRICGFAALAVVSHAQILIVFVSMVFNFFFNQMLKLFNTGRISKSMLVIIPVSLLVPLLVVNQIIYKLKLFPGQRGLTEVPRILAFLLLALWYSRERRGTVLIFIPLVIAVLLVGGSRLNLFGYFVFLYYGLQFRGGWNFGVLATSAYYANSAIHFLINIILRGNGFSGSITGF